MKREPLARNRTGAIFLEYNLKYHKFAVNLFKSRFEYIHREANQLFACTFSAASLERGGEARWNQSLGRFSLSGQFDDSAAGSSPLTWWWSLFATRATPVID